MTKTVTSLFHSEQHAAAAMNRLEQVGIPKGSIDIWSTPHNLVPVLEDAGVSASDAHAYTEGVRRGGSLVIVHCNDDQVDRAVSVLDREGVLDLDEQQTSWRSEGWQVPAAAGLTSPSSSAATGGSNTVEHGRVRIQILRVERRIEE